MERILIAEDDEKIAQLEQDYLKINGFETEVVGKRRWSFPDCKAGNLIWRFWM